MSQNAPVERHRARCEGETEPGEQDWVDGSCTVWFSMGFLKASAIGVSRLIRHLMLQAGMGDILARTMSSAIQKRFKSTGGANNFEQNPRLIKSSNRILRSM